MSTVPSSSAAPSASRTTHLRSWAPALSAAALGVAVAFLALTLDALRGAGLNGKAPPNAAPFKKLVDTITDNVEWFIITGLGLALLVGAVFFFAGSQRAPDYLGKVIVGVVLIIAGIPAILA